MKVDSVLGPKVPTRAQTIKNRRDEKKEQDRKQQRDNSREDKHEQKKRSKRNAGPLSRQVGEGTGEEDEGGQAEEWRVDRGIMAAGCPPMAWGVVMLHADEVPHRRRCCQVLALSQSPFSSLSPWPPPAPGTPLGPALYNPRGALQPGIQHQAPRHFSCTCSHIVGYALIHKPINRHTQTTTKETMRNGSLPPPFTVSTTGLGLNTR